jgi:hypothetical protein
MRPFALLAVLALGALFAPPAIAYPSGPAPVSGQYSGEAADHDGNKHPIAFEVQFGPKLIKNVQFGAHHLGNGVISIHKPSGLPEEWLFTGGTGNFHFSGGWGNPNAANGQVREINPHKVWFFRAYKR